MILGTQYYRPPFPERRRWSVDMARMRESGLNTVQLWACWGWIEAELGEYSFEDYDELLSLAAEADLSVVISSVAEIHPFWIHRIVPGSNMVDHTGATVVSSLRKECNVGLTPGGCTDNPAVLAHMKAFLHALADHYRDAPNLVAWDCWNETRWAVQADGFVCYCDHTIGAYRTYLDKRYGGLEGLNEAWKRRYRSWDDVQPGKLPDRPYTDLMEFQGFLTARAAEHAAMRWEVLRSADPHHPIVAHCGTPSIFSTGSGFEQALARGNDWDLADNLDGFGSSHFPVWQKLSEVDLGTRLEAMRSATAAKPMWVSELQGGSARNAIDVTDPVPAALQQRWVRSAVGRGAKAVIFWCWRDEVFGGESSGFGLSGLDGEAEERLRALTVTGEVFRQHGHLLDAYLPDRARVGVLFEERNYYLDWAQYGSACEQAGGSVVGYLRALERIQVPYNVVDSGHLDGLEELRLVVMPWPLVVNDRVADRIVGWVERGGALVVESEVDAYDERGFYRYPAERELAVRLGVYSSGRRPIKVPQCEVRLGERGYHLDTATWVEAFDGRGAEALGTMDGEVVATKRALGKGTIIAIGTFAGLAYNGKRNPEFEGFLDAIATAAGCGPQLSSPGQNGDGLQWRLGTAGNEHVLFVMSSTGADEHTFRGPASLFAAGELHELMGGARAKVEVAGSHSTVTLPISNGGVAVWAWPRATEPQQ